LQHSQNIWSWPVGIDRRLTRNSERLRNSTGGDGRLACRGLRGGGHVCSRFVTRNSVETDTEAGCLQRATVVQTLPEWDLDVEVGLALAQGVIFGASLVDDCVAGIAARHVAAVATRGAAGLRSSEHESGGGKDGGEDNGGTHDNGD
jgi:hypothetical protein